MLSRGGMNCCCGHDENVHLGGPDLTQDQLNALYATHPGGDGGMCRARVGSGRCDCFNFCDCWTVTADGEPDEPEAVRGVRSLIPPRTQPKGVACPTS
jgi:hypothetical protein